MPLPFESEDQPFNSPLPPAPPNPPDSEEACGGADFAYATYSDVWNWGDRAPAGNVWLQRGKLLKRFDGELMWYRWIYAFERPVYGEWLPNRAVVNPSSQDQADSYIDGLPTGNYFYQPPGVWTSFLRPELGEPILTAVRYFYVMLVPGNLPACEGGGAGDICDPVTGRCKCCEIGSRVLAAFGESV